MRIAAAGDLVLMRPIQRPAESLLTCLEGADLVAANLEVPLTAAASPIRKGLTLRADPELIQDLAGLGVNVVTLANNHAGDQGWPALRELAAARGQSGNVLFPYVYTSALGTAGYRRIGALGEIVHEDLNHSGQHPAIIDAKTWQAVQALLNENRNDNRTRTNANRTVPRQLSHLCRGPTAEGIQSRNECSFRAQRMPCRTAPRAGRDDQGHQAPGGLPQGAGGAVHHADHGRGRRSFGLLHRFRKYGNGLQEPRQEIHRQVEGHLAFW